MANTLNTGAILESKNYSYRILTVVGEESLCNTYSAQITDKNSPEMASREVIIKELSTPATPNDESTVIDGSEAEQRANFCATFNNKAIELSQLSHPNIVKIIEIFEANGAHYYAIEKCEGNTLEQLTAQGVALSENESVDYITQVCAALAYTRANNTTHLSLNPNNIILRESEGVAVVDFGILTPHHKDATSQLTYTPIELSEEAKDGERPITADIYIIGATLYAMLTGASAPSANIIVEEGLPLEPLQERGVSDNTIACIIRAMASHKNYRHQSIEEFLTDLKDGIISYVEEPIEEDIVEETTDTNDVEEEPQETNDVVEEPQDTNDVVVEPQEVEERTVPIEIEKPVKNKSGFSLGKKSRIALIVVPIIIIIGSIAGYCLYKFTPKERPATPQDNPPQVYLDYKESVNDIEIDMVYVPGGTFTMGATKEQMESGHKIEQDKEYPHEVTLDGFYIGATEITQAQWEAIMGTNINDLVTNKRIFYTNDNSPIYYVDYDEATEFCRTLSSLTGKSYRLPTEAEWEYAARGGRSGGTIFSGSNDVDRVAWHYKNAFFSPKEVASLAPNALEIYDMSGNVYEWCSDIYDEEYYKNSPQNNPTGPDEGDRYVIRGGCITSMDYTHYRVSHRYGAPKNSKFFIGFRIVCEL